MLPDQRYVVKAETKVKSPGERTELSLWRALKTDRAGRRHDVNGWEERTARNAEPVDPAIGTTQLASAWSNACF
jgi:hypothetical protein